MNIGSLVRDRRGSVRLTPSGEDGLTRAPRNGTFSTAWGYFWMSQVVRVRVCACACVCAC